MNSDIKYGVGDATYRAAGQEAGVRALVDAFYDIMGSDERFRTIWDLHPQDKVTTRDKLTRFLCAWMGGPRRYNEKYGPISIPKAHAHLSIGEDEKGQWLKCMEQALAKQDYPESLRNYLLEQLAVPASHVVKSSRRKTPN